MPIHGTNVLHIIEARDEQEDESQYSNEEKGNDSDDDGSGANLVACFGGDHISTVRALEVRYRLLSEGGCYHCWLRLHNSNLQTDRQTGRQTQMKKCMHTHKHTVIHTHVRTHTWTHTHGRTHTDKHTHAQTQTLSLSLSLTHTHARTHTHTQRETERAASSSHGTLSQRSTTPLVPLINSQPSNTQPPYPHICGVGVMRRLLVRVRGGSRLRRVRALLVSLQRVLTLSVVGGRSLLITHLWRE